MTAEVFLPVLVGICLALVGWQVIRQPLLRRLAIRDATRRPSETLLVIAGSLLGTALITGSFIVGDTLDTSIRATAFTQLGPVDEIVIVPEADEAERLVEALEAAGDPNIDGVMSAVGVDASFATASGRELAEPEAQLLELDFETAESFGGDAAATGITGRSPGQGEVVLSEDLAARLRTEEGDRVAAFLYGNEVELEVTGILPRLGLAGFWLGFESTSANAFVSPGTIERLTAEGTPEGSVPPVTTVLVSNRGGVEEGAELTGPVTETIESAIGSSATLRVEPVKEDRLDAADAQGKEFGELFLAIGAFAIVAGILLLVNIFVMLAEERKSQLGMLRAVGMRRGSLVRAFVIEGTIYSLASAALGTLLGIGVGWAIATLAAPIFGGIDDFSLDLRFSIDPASLVIGFCAGALISLVTIVLTSLRISRINIIRAIRDIPEPKLYRSRTRTVVIGTVFAVMMLLWFVSSLGDKAQWAPAILGPILGVYALLPLMSRLFARRVAVLGAASFSIFWGLFGNTILNGQFFDAGELFAFNLQGILLTFSAVVLLTQTQETFEGAIRRVAARNLPLRLSIAYPLARRARTGLTLGMFALVIFTMTFIAVLSNVFGAQVDTAVAKEGDYDVLATASDSNPPSSERIESIEGVETAVPLLFGNALFDVEDLPEPEPWTVSGIDERFVEGGPPSLPERVKGMSAVEVWERVVADPTAVVVPGFFLQSEGGPPQALVEVGDTITVIDPLTGAEVEREIVGMSDNDYAFSGVYMSKSSLRDALGERVPVNRFYIEAEDRAGDAEVAARIQGELVANGVEADSIRSIVEDFQRSNLQFFRLMQSYLALGLTVGIAGLGVVMVRAVRERRRDVGVLRSLGFLPSQVGRAFVLEAGFVALEGILVGVALALVSSFQLINTGEFGEDMAFPVPWGQLALLTTLALVASLLATAWPARQASQIPPAVALRIAD